MPLTTFLDAYRKRINRRDVLCTVFFTCFAAVPLWFIGTPWLCMLCGVEVIGDVTKDLKSVRYFDRTGQTHLVPAYYTMHETFRIWGEPASVQYLPFTPSVSWYTECEDNWKFTPLLLIFAVFVAVPLAILWWTNILGPAVKAYREACMTLRECK